MKKYIYKIPQSRTDRSENMGIWKLGIAKLLCNDAAPQIYTSTKMCQGLFD